MLAMETAMTRSWISEPTERTRQLVNLEALIIVNKGNAIAFTYAALPTHFPHYQCRYSHRISQ